MTIKELSKDEMCKLKADFFRDDEVVVQFHPAKSDSPPIVLLYLRTGFRLE